MQERENEEDEKSGRGAPRIWDGRGEATFVAVLAHSSKVQGVRKSLRILTPHYFLAWLEISGSYLVW